MKKQNEVKNNEAKVEKTKRAKKERTFFLYVEDKGFIYANDEGLPVFEAEGNDIIKFNQRKMAMFAVEFFKGIKVAEDIKVFMNIA